LLTGHAPAPTSPIVDHIIPHRGNLALFWDEENLQAVCKEYHDGEKQRLERANHRPA
jgi:5-methylcytosine-specific restriction endonuclease McrA